MEPDRWCWTRLAGRRRQLKARCTGAKTWAPGRAAALAGRAPATTTHSEACCGKLCRMGPAHVIPAAGRSRAARGEKLADLLRSRITLSSEAIIVLTSRPASCQPVTPSLCKPSSAVAKEALGSVDPELTATEAGVRPVPAQKSSVDEGCPESERRHLSEVELHAQAGTEVRQQAGKAGFPWSKRERRGGGGRGGGGGGRERRRRRRRRGGGGGGDCSAGK